jgi:hypothetical protein
MREREREKRTIVIENDKRRGVIKADSRGKEREREKERESNSRSLDADAVRGNDRL